MNLTQYNNSMFEFSPIKTSHDHIHLNLVASITVQWYILKETVKSQIDSNKVHALSLNTANEQENKKISTSI